MLRRHSTRQDTAACVLPILLLVAWSTLAAERKSEPPQSGAASAPSPLQIPRVEAAAVSPAMSHGQIEAGLKSHDRALFIKQGWIRDPYILVGPDEVQSF